MNEVILSGHVRKQLARNGRPRYYVILELSPDPKTGKRRQKGVGGHATRKAAEVALREILVWAGHGSPALHAHLTVAELVDEWLAHAQRRGKLPIRANTASTYATYIKTQIKPRIGALRVQALTPGQLEGLYAQIRAAGRAPKTVRHVHTILHAALEYAVRRGYVHRNVAAVADAPQVPRAEPPAWTTEQVQEFLAEAAADRLSALWLLAATTGLRRSELLGLAWDALDLDADPATLAVAQTLLVIDGVPTLVPRTKNDTSRRQITLPPEAVAALREHAVHQHQERLAWGEGYQQHGLVFTWEDGGILRPDWVTRRCTELARAAGLSGSLHALRHAHATAMLAAEIDPRIASHRLGHASTAVTTDLYQHVSPAIDAAAVARLPTLSPTEPRSG